MDAVAEIMRHTVAAERSLAEYGMVLGQAIEQGGSVSPVAEVVPSTDSPAADLAS